MTRRARSNDTRFTRASSAASGRFNYDEVQEILDGLRDDPYAPKLKRFDALAKQLLALRIERGAIDFETVEAKQSLTSAAW